MPFKKGDKFGHGGARPGSGRPPNWFKERCKELGYTIDTPELWAKVAQGIQIHKDLPLKMSDVIEASKLLTEYGEGKAFQPSEVTISGISNIPNDVLEQIASGNSKNGSSLESGK